MKRRFVIPAAVALALHAIFLFGFRSAHPELTRRHSPAPPPAPPPVDWVRVEWAGDPEEQIATILQGRLGEVLPDLPEPPPRESITEISMSPSVPSPRPISAKTMLTIGPFGDPMSNADGFGPGGGPINSALLDHAPRTRAQIAPVYPYEARVAGRPGEVLVAFEVDETGHVLDPHVLRSSDPVFEATTLRAVAKWRFEPGRIGGRVVRFRMAVPVAFTLNP